MIEPSAEKHFIAYFDLLSRLVFFIFGIVMTATLCFASSSQQQEEINLAFVGDVILHDRLRLSLEASNEKYENIWSGLQGYIASADLSYANIEGPVATELAKPSGFPRFNYPTEIISSLMLSGFDVVSTANNHSLDLGSAGVIKTIENLRKAQLGYTGTVTDPEKVTQKLETWWHLSEVRGFKIAWLSCTEMTNGLRDRKQQVLYCFKDRKLIKKIIQQLKSELKASAIILLPHWGEEEQFEIESYRRRWAQIMLNAGAAAVVGSHPHVIQKIEKFTTKDKRSTVIAYSLGNFISNQYWTKTKTSLLLLLKFISPSGGNSGATNSGSAGGGELIISSIKYIPIWMNRKIKSKKHIDFRLVPVFDLSKTNLEVPAEARNIWLDQLDERLRIKNHSEVQDFLTNGAR